jgi:hypothetical protein
MRTLITAFTFAAVIGAFVPAANAAPRSDQSEAAGQSSGGTYQGYPLRDWYRPDSW